MIETTVIKCLLGYLDDNDHSVTCSAVEAFSALARNSKRFWFWRYDARIYHVSDHFRATMLVQHILNRIFDFFQHSDYDVRKSSVNTFNSFVEFGAVTRFAHIQWPTHWLIAH